MFWDGLPIADVDGDVARVDAPLQLAHLGVFTSASEQPGRLYSEVANLAQITTHDSCMSAKEDAAMFIVLMPLDCTHFDGHASKGMLDVFGTAQVLPSQNFLRLESD